MKRIGGSVMDSRRVIFILTLYCMVPKSICQLIRDRSVNCQSHAMEVAFEFAQPFSGIIYANKFYQTKDCRWEGDGSHRLVVPVPLNTNTNTEPYCGVQVQENTGEFTVMLVVTPMKGLLVEGMTGLNVRCLYNIGDVTLTLPAGPNGAGIFIRYFDDSPQTQAGIVTGSGGSPFLQMAIRDGHGISGEIVQAASVGQRITLDIIMQDTAIYDFYVHDCYAHDGTNTPEASISIIDANGCAVRLSRAVDVPVFTTPAVSGGAKHVYVHMYGFQFTTSQLVYFECQVRPCLQACNRQQCEASLRSKRNSIENGNLKSLSKRQAEDQTIDGSLQDNYKLHAILQIRPQSLNSVIPLARDDPSDSVARAGFDGNEICIHMNVGIAILVIFIVVCAVSLLVAVFVCHRAHSESKDVDRFYHRSKDMATYYTPSLGPSDHEISATPSPRSSQYNTRPSHGRRQTPPERAVIEN